MRGPLWASVWAVGCTGGTTSPVDDGPPHSATVPTDAATGGTGDTGDGGPTHTGTPTASLSVSCAATDNALRFACSVSVSPPSAVEVAFAPADGTGPERVLASDELGREHVVTTWFMRPSTVYAIEARRRGAPAGSGVSASVTTGAVPYELAGHLQVEGTSTTRYVGTNLPCAGGRAVASVFDTVTGAQVWYEVMATNGTFGGFDMVQFTEDHTVLGQTGVQIVEVDPAGVELLRKDYTDPFHHDLFRRHGKTWILYSEDVGGGLKLDGFVVWDAQGRELSRWREATAFDVPPGSTGDWSHTNTVWVGQDESVLLSLYTQHTLVKVDPAGEVAWVMDGATGGGLGNDVGLNWGPVGGDDSFSRQHSASYRADGRLQLLDNDHGRGLVLSLDEGTLRGTVEASFATGTPSCGPQGTAIATAAGNTMVGCSGMLLREYADAVNPVWTSTLVCADGASGGGPNAPVRWYPLDGW